MSDYQWERSRRLHLVGTDLALDPEYASAYWFVIDITKPDESLTSALPLKIAKQSAERIAELRAQIDIDDG